MHSGTACIFHCGIKSEMYFRPIKKYFYVVKCTSISLDLHITAKSVKSLTFMHIYDIGRCGDLTNIQMDLEIGRHHKSFY